MSVPGQLPPNVELVGGRLMKIPRPPNAFLLFSRDYRRRLQTTYPHENNREISQRLGDLWRQLGTDVRDKYFQRAHEEAIHHRNKYPNYEFRPKKKNLSRNEPLDHVDEGFCLQSGLPCDMALPSDTTNGYVTDQTQTLTGIESMLPTDKQPLSSVKVNKAQSCNSERTSETLKKIPYQGNGASHSPADRTDTQIKSMKTFDSAGKSEISEKIPQQMTDISQSPVVTVTQHKSRKNIQPIKDKNVTCPKISKRARKRRTIQNSLEQSDKEEQTSPICTDCPRRNTGKCRKTSSTETETASQDLPDLQSVRPRRNQSSSTPLNRKAYILQSFRSEQAAEDKGESPRTPYELRKKHNRIQGNSIIHETKDKLTEGQQKTCTQEVPKPVPVKRKHATRKTVKVHSSSVADETIINSNNNENCTSSASSQGAESLSIHKTPPRPRYLSSTGDGLSGEILTQYRENQYYKKYVTPDVDRSPRMSQLLKEIRNSPCVAKDYLSVGKSQQTSGQSQSSVLYGGSHVATSYNLQGGSLGLVAQPDGSIITHCCCGRGVESHSAAAILARQLFSADTLPPVSNEFQQPVKSDQECPRDSCSSNIAAVQPDDQSNGHIVQDLLTAPEPATSLYTTVSNTNEQNKHTLKIPSLRSLAAAVVTHMRRTLMKSAVTNVRKTPRAYTPRMFIVPPELHKNSNEDATYQMDNVSVSNMPHQMASGRSNLCNMQILCRDGILYEYPRQDSANRNIPRNYTNRRHYKSMLYPSGYSQPQGAKSLIQYAFEQANEDNEDENVQIKMNPEHNMWTTPGLLPCVRTLSRSSSTESLRLVSVTCVGDTEDCNDDEEPSSITNSDTSTRNSNFSSSQANSVYNQDQELYVDASGHVAPTAGTPDIPLSGSSNDNQGPPSDGLYWADTQSVGYEMLTQDQYECSYPAFPPGLHTWTTSSQDLYCSSPTAEMTNNGMYYYNTHDMTIDSGYWPYEESSAFLQSSSLFGSNQEENLFNQMHYSDIMSSSGHEYVSNSIEECFAEPQEMPDNGKEKVNQVTPESCTQLQDGASPAIWRTPRTPNRSTPGHPVASQQSESWVSGGMNDSSGSLHLSYLNSSHMLQTPSGEVTPVPSKWRDFDSTSSSSGTNSSLCSSVRSSDSCLSGAVSRLQTSSDSSTSSIAVQCGNMGHAQEVLAQTGNIENEQFYGALQSQILSSEYGNESETEGKSEVVTATVNSLVADKPMLGCVNDIEENDNEILAAGSGTESGSKTGKKSALSGLEVQENIFLHESSEGPSKLTLTAEPTESFESSKSETKGQRGMTMINIDNGASGTCEKGEEETSDSTTLIGTVHSQTLQGFQTSDESQLSYAVTESKTLCDMIVSSPCLQTETAITNPTPSSGHDTESDQQLDVPCVSDTSVSYA